MRVISGVARGLKLKDPKDAKVRPTTEKVKEAVFDAFSQDNLPSYSMPVIIVGIKTSSSDLPKPFLYVFITLGNTFDK